ncbi:MAG: hypothetical protein QNJ29_12160 [Rhizobiaceae bacterium]|nr:hypothetical protein [Rhizobiaceae bacterium]
MFKNSAKSIFAAFALAAASITLASPASAGSSKNFGIYIGGGHGGIYYGGGQRYNPYYPRGHRHYKHRKHNYRSRNHISHRGHCAPRRALRKAWNIGLNQPHIARINKRKIVVAGYNRGHHAKVVFKRNSHRCKVIGTRGLY